MGYGPLEERRGGGGEILCSFLIPLFKLFYCINSLPFPGFTTVWVRIPFSHSPITHGPLGQEDFLLPHYGLLHGNAVALSTNKIASCVHISTEGFYDISSVSKIRSMSPPGSQLEGFPPTLSASNCPGRSVGCC